LTKELLRPLEEIFDVDRDSPLYTDPERNVVFYGQSLAIVHYLMIGKGSSGRQQLARFIHLLADGNGHAAALRNVHVESLNQELETYVAKGNFGILTLDLDPIAIKKTFDGIPLKPAEVDYYLGDLLLHIRRLDESNRYLRRAVEKNPNLAAAYESLGFLHLLRDDRKSAELYFKKAVVLDSASYVAHYHYARALTREYFLKDTVDGIPEDIAEPAVAALRASLALRPDFGDAARMLGHIFLLRNENIAEGIAHLERSLSSSPKNPRVVFVLARLQERNGNHRAAIENLSWIVRTAADPVLQKAAQQELDRLQKKKW
jgi:tetratricopeptide (TPR) repeat protein